MLCWIKEHKKQLAAAGVCIGAVLLAIWGIRHRSQLKALWSELKFLIHTPAQEGASSIPELSREVARSVEEDVAVVKQVFDTAVMGSTNPIQEAPNVITITSAVIPEHLRTLPKGWHPSPAKIEEALSKGITLLDNQTLVDSYLRGGVA